MSEPWIPGEAIFIFVVVIVPCFLWMWIEKRKKRSDRHGYKL